MKIAVYAIAKNEAKHVERFCQSARDADVIFVADTGSTDNTVDLLLHYADEVTQIHISPWRFDDARNAALAMLPADIDVCISLDLDEVLQPGWRQEIERVWIDGTTRLRYGFDWGAGIQFQYEKIHARHGYRWTLPCHEHPVPYRIQEVWADTDKLLVVHKPDPEKSRGQYLDLLKLSVEENPLEPRNAFYYARELSFRGKWADAIYEVTRFLALPRANWPNERCYAMRVAGKCSQEIRDSEGALKWFRLATSESPYTREPWHDLAQCCYQNSRWAECLGAALTCLSITNREKVYTTEPTVWGAAPHDWASIAAYNLGLYALATEHARKAVELDPSDFRLRQNLEFCEAKAA